jgi:hypothetical protein
MLDNNHSLKHVKFWIRINITNSDEVNTKKYSHQVTFYSAQ